MELQLIPSKIITDESLCPCCKQQIIQHRNGQRIGRIPFTRHNILPRIKRASRKNASVGIIVTTVVAIVIFMLRILNCPVTYT
ncbi:hypothetical protein I4U23_005665 [Adineta vaga]|nr:hypothetical protein I4U23_005665 [Adineta vaga]